MYASKIETGVRQVLRWMAAAHQDDHPGIKMLHANYAVGYLSLLRQLYPDEEIYRVSGYHPLKLQESAIDLQDEAFLEASGICPDLKPPIPLSGLGDQPTPPNIFRVPVFWMGVFGSLLATMVFFSGKRMFVRRCF